MKQLFVSIVSLMVISTVGHSTPPASEFRVSENQSVAEVFKNLSEAHQMEGNFQILVTPEVAERALTGLVLRNIAFDRSIQLICKRNKLSYMQKGKLFVITGGSEAIAIFHEEMNGSPLAIQKPLDHQTERRKISQMPVIGERPEFDMVWEIKQELEELHKRMAALEESPANSRSEQ